MARSRSEMIAETRGKLIAAGRKAFAERGYAEASMDDFTAAAGLTRGALYHHFGDKRGLFEAVVSTIDAEMTARIELLQAEAPSAWEGFILWGTAYIEMALEPEIRQILLRDGPAVLGDPASWPTTNTCIGTLSGMVEALIADGTIRAVDAEATARLLTGASCYAATWIANADDPPAVLPRATAGYRDLVEGLLKR
ncbi:MAG TPA: TetR/AcrR family transcriptional regulator [Devosia sp.]